MDPGALDSLARLDEITRRLRRECPWDREQDARSIVPHTVEECYELADAARRDDTEAMVDELGDVLFQVLFLSLLLEERGEGDLAAVAESCAAKLIRRHPHVYGDRELESAGEVLAQWEQIKRDVEGRAEPLGLCPKRCPRCCTRARRCGGPTRRARRPAPSPAARADEAARERAEREVGEALLEAVRRSRGSASTPSWPCGAPPTGSPERLATVHPMSAQES